MDRKALGILGHTRMVLNIHGVHGSISYEIGVPDAWGHPKIWGYEQMPPNVWEGVKSMP